MNKYHEQANNFLAKYGIAFSARCTGDEQSTVLPTCRNYVYVVTFERFSNKTQRMISVSFEFHDSISNYEKNIKRIYAYDVLACLTTYNPGMFYDFCDEYDYDKDSRKAFAIYEATCKEWKKVSSFFKPKEIEEMQEIY